MATGLVAMLVVVGLARTYLGAHYFTDVLAGYLIGFVWADLVILAGYLLGCRWQQCLPDKR
jgi:undecaprenyl-diphosphatase